MIQANAHLVLLGDSIFDNAVYVPGGSAVIDHLGAALPSRFHVTLIARDGDVVANISEQIERLPPGATHLVVSIGGNDALNAQSVMSLPATTVYSALAHLSRVREEFGQAYRAMLRKVLDRKLPTAVCTIYDSVPDLGPELQTALCLFNDTITREAMAAGVPVIDLRDVCIERTDYSSISPIEPSGTGGYKIAQAIMKWLS
jgi:lysophospholipase L1-like esterase